VALKNSVWRVKGVSWKMRSISGMNPLAAFEMVQKAAGCRDQHIDAPVDQLVLLAKGYAADQQRLGQLGVPGIGVEILGHLGGQFARGGKHQAARHPGAGAALTQKGDHRQGEAGGLAGAGLGNAQNIAALQRLGDGLGLNRGRCFVSGFFNSLQYARVQREVGKFRHMRPKRCGIGPHSE